MVPLSKNMTVNVSVIETPKSTNMNDTYEVANLVVRNVCLCGKSCFMITNKKDYSFECYHCKLYYHIQCMQRGKNSVSQSDPIKKLVSCSFCHLRELIPTRKVWKTLFQGVLKQGRKKHSIIFNLDINELRNKKYKLQVRSFRIK